MARQYEGWTIKTGFDSASLGDVSGLDEAASIRGYSDALQGELEAKFPGADITVEFGTTGTKAYAPQGQEDDEDSITEEVDEIGNNVFENVKWWIEA